jgi:hypothetical protein
LVTGFAFTDREELDGMRVRALVLAVAAMIAASAVLPSASLAATRTTTPTKFVLIVFIITDRGATVGKFASAPNHDSMIPVPEIIPRGDIMTINVLNRSKKVLTFSVFGKKTPPIKPGGKGHLQQIALVRGSFQWTSKVGPAVLHHGFLIIA